MGAGSDGQAAKAATVNERVLLHLREHSIAGERGDYPPALTQEGIAEAIGIRPNHVPRAVRRLCAEGLVGERSAHVGGFARRRKVYLLTESGHAVAEEVRGRLAQGTFTVAFPDGKKDELDAIEISKRFACKPSLTRILAAQDDDGVVQLSKLESAPTVRGGLVDFSSRFQGPEHFYGRAAELARLKNILARSDGRAAVISGVKGIGKSALAHRLAQDVKGERHVFWHTCRSWEDPYAIVTTLAEFLSAAGKGRVKSSLARRGNGIAGLVDAAAEDFADLPSLLVIDNLFELDEKAANLCTHMVEKLAAVGCAKVVITTRDPRLSERLRADELRLEGLDRASAQALYDSLGAPKAEFDRVFAMTSGHPLAIELIASGEVTDPEDEKGLTTEERLMMRSLRAFDVIFG
ncbi:MAG: AAA family ATPase [Euryarchaeota archaeon]|nr:AAA family ATPase [Euryarchaeota archaeon]